MFFIFSLKFFQTCIYSTEEYYVPASVHEYKDTVMGWKLFTLKLTAWLLNHLHTAKWSTRKQGGPWDCVLYPFSTTAQVTHSITSLLKENGGRRHWWITVMSKQNGKTDYHRLVSKRTRHLYQHIFYSFWYSVRQV